MDFISLIFLVIVCFVRVQAVVLHVVFTFISILCTTLLDHFPHSCRISLVLLSCRAFFVDTMYILYHVVNKNKSVSSEFPFWGWNLPQKAIIFSFI